MMSTHHMHRCEGFFLSAANHGGNLTIKSTVVCDNDGATDDDVTNDDDEANAGDAGGADKDRVGGTGGGTMCLARVATMFFFWSAAKTQQSNRPSFATMTARRTTT